MGIGIWGDLPRITEINGKDKIDKAYKSRNHDIKSIKDSITISEGAKDYSMITKVLKDLPDVREEKVKELMDRLDNGDYLIEDNDVAEKFMEFLQTDNT